MKKGLKITISLVCILTLLILGLKGLRYLVTDDTRSFTRLMMHDLYTQEENIDYLFVGSSHCYRSVIPSVIDEKKGGNSFNCGSSAQRMDGSLTLIKEVLIEHQPKVIVLDIYYDMIDTVNHSERDQLTSTYAIADYMKFSWNKISYLLNASSMDYYTNSFIVGRRNWKKLYDFDYIKSLLDKKSSEEYKNYVWKHDEDDEGYYCDRGYVAFDGKAEDDCSEEDMEPIRIAIDSFTEEWKEELKEVVSICRKNDIKLIVVAAPLPSKTLNLIQNYDEYVSFISTMLKEMDVDYYDFNLPEYKIDEIGDDCFKDRDHLNSKGAQIYSNSLADLL
ncbi:MAG: hypothetical protein MJ133_01210 [Lachnospiraceae bacterium]|nr:hypothetical protein [Lachnospiraceae bacterium]